MRYQVPQFVDIEDKIVGPFTLKQFLTYLGGVFFLIPLYLVFDLSLFMTLALPIMGICAAFAHLRVNGKSLAAVIGNAVNFALRGQYFIWRRDAGATKPLLISGSEYGDFSPSGAAPMPSASMLSERARALETEGSVTAEDVEDPFTKEA